MFFFYIPSKWKKLCFISRDLVQSKLMLFILLYGLISTVYDDVWNKRFYAFLHNKTNHRIRISLKFFGKKLGKNPEGIIGIHMTKHSRSFWEKLREFHVYHINRESIHKIFSDKFVS